MSFLDKAKTQANNIINNGNKGGAPMGNPFVKQQTVNTQSPAAAPVANKPSIPGAKPQVPGVKPQVPGVKPNIPGKPSIPGAKPQTPVTKPQVPSPAPVEKEEVKETTTPANPFSKPAVPTPAPVEEPKVEETVETKVETPAVAEEVKEEVVEVKEEVAAKANETEKKEDKVEEKKTGKKKSSRKKTTKTEEVKDNASNETDEVEEIVIPKTDMSYADACQSIRSNFVDEEWDAQVAYFEEKSRNILISNDMNKAQLHDLLAQVTNLRDEMYTAFVSVKTLYEHLTEKETGLIDVTKRLHGKGSNPEERKYHATIAVMNYKSESGDNINLYELLAETRNRYNFLKGINETIEFKKAVLLTMLSSLKSN